MSKFCPNCGQVLEDSAVFCNSCGASVSAATNAAPAYQQSQYQSAPVAAPAQPAADKKPSIDVNKIVEQVKTFCIGFVNRCKADKPFLYKVAGIAAAAVLVLILLIVLLSAKPYQSAIANYLDVSLEGQVKKIEKLAPKAYWEYLEEEYEVDADDVADAYEEYYEDDTLEMLEEEYGENIRISFKITDEDEMKEKKVKELADTLKEAYGISKKDVKAAYEVEIDYTIKGDDDEDEDDMELIVVKIGSKWYVTSALGELLYVARYA